MVKEFTDAMHAAGMKVALYVAPLDDNYPSSSPTYETYFKNQLTELLDSATKFNTISIREPTELGERATAYHIEIKQSGRWDKNPTDVSNAAIAGTVIGQRQLWQLGSTTADAIALVIDSAKDVPVIAEFGVYLTQ